MKQVNYRRRTVQEECLRITLLKKIIRKKEKDQEARKRRQQQDEEFEALFGEIEEVNPYKIELSRDES